MVALYERKRSLVQAAAAFGCSQTTIRGALRRAGVAVQPSGGRRLPPGTPPRWGRRTASNGYIVWFGWIPGENRYAVIADHRFVMEEKLGRPLERHEQVHHKNGRRDDNRLENLELRIGNHGAGATHCPHCGGAL